MQKAKALLATSVIVLTGLAVAPLAQAVNGYAYHPSDPSYARVWDHHWFHACDRHVDGHRVRMHYYTIASPEWLIYSGWAPSRGCTERASSSLGTRIAKFRICVEAEGCGRWKQ